MKASMPLEGVKVIDFTTFVAASAATSFLGYLGADVVRVETPKGDPFRAFGAGFGVPTKEDENPCYDAINGYKRSVSLNLRSPEGMQAMRRLLEKADILVTNYRPNALAAMHLTYTDVKRINPRIVFASNNGYGQKGSDAPRPGFDATAFYARSGLSLAATYKNAPPAVNPAAGGDVATSMALTTGILAGYLQAKTTGIGCEIQTSLLAVAMWVAAVPCVNQQFRTTKPEFGKPTYYAIASDYLCGDGNWIRLSGQSVERYWPGFCQALGLDEYAEDARFSTGPAMCANGEACYSLISEKIKAKPLADWIRILKENDLPFEVINTCLMAIHDEQVVANNYVKSFDYPDHRDVRLAMPPITITGAEPAERKPASKLGADTVEVLTEYGFSDAEIQALLACGGAVQHA